MRRQIRKAALVLAVVLGCAAAQAWDWTSRCDALKDDHFLVKAGIGYGYALGKFKVDGVGKVKGAVLGTVIPIQAEYLLGDLPLGITLNVRPLFGKYAGVKARGLTVMAGANYHVAPGPKWFDLYAGLGMGIHYASSTYETLEEIYDPSYLGGRFPKDVKKVDEKIKGVAFAIDAHVGANFMFAKHFGVNVEFGYPTYLSAAAAFKF